MGRGGGAAGAEGSGVEVLATTTAAAAPSLSLSSSSSTTAMLAEAEALLREGSAEDALPIALHALDTLKQEQQAARPNTTTPPPPPTAALPILNTIAEIHLELGSAPTARTYFLHAVSLDPTGLIPSTHGSGADKFLQLAQLSSQGGEDSIGWYSRGAAVLRQEISSSLRKEKGDDDGQEDEEGGGEEEEGPTSQRKKLAGALCGMVEIYMTDLSWDANAETQCESLIAEALLVAPSCPEPLQTLASIRISQGRVAEAREALRGSMGMWGGMEDEDDDGDDDDEEAAVPDFATRVSLARLLMEVGMEEEALGVVERLVLEDDGSVEAWYLGGWCLYLLGVKRGEGGDDGREDVNGDEEGKGEEDLYIESMVSSREWLRQSLKLYELVEYEDGRLRDHARELVAELDAIIGGRGDDEVDGEEEEEEEWNGFGEESEEEEQEDEIMDEG